ncbi:MAG TPA: radical SAM protein [Prolixibacteraceae bacterium]|nr:radical SAM protein [Prolixibacteraceae bacterium]
MKTYLDFLSTLARNTEKAHAAYSRPLNWYHPYKSIDLEEKRNELFRELEPVLNWAFKRTKPYLGSLSPGCRICGEGDWSCLFVTGKCNASCFYCPARQDDDGIPQTQKLLFDTPEKYAAYIRHFGVRGVSFSGGEPFLYFERTLAYLKAVRKLCDPSVYCWMYTNGILVSDEKLKQLADAGLNEIRFDLGAVNYQTRVLNQAARFIPNVTVEIPAVPGDSARLKEILPRLCDLGVSRLNLHLLRLTQHNAEKLLQHNYTYLHYEQPVVAESELTALEIMQFVCEQKLPIGVNYCSFAFKNRFQKAGFRRIMAKRLALPGEAITENGFLRKMEAADGNGILSLETLLAGREPYPPIVLSYSGRVPDNLGKLPGARNYVIGDTPYPLNEGLVAQAIRLLGDQSAAFVHMMREEGKTLPDDPVLFEVWKHEFIEEGLRDFF